MHSKRSHGTEPIVSAIKTPLLQAAAHLYPYGARIAAAWRRMLRHYEPCRPFISVLAGMRLSQRLKEATGVSRRLYWDETERSGMDLARAGVPAGCIALAVALYVEGCFRYLTADDSRSVRWRRALSRWAAAYQFSLLSGYTQYVAANQQTLE